MYKKQVEELLLWFALVDLWERPPSMTIALSAKDKEVIENDEESNDSKH